MSGAPKCGSCGSAIRWGVTVDGARMPLDPEPVENGNVYVFPKSGQFRVLTDDERARAVEAGVALYLSHHASCPGRGRHRVPRSQLSMDVGGAA